MERTQGPEFRKKLVLILSPGEMFVSGKVTTVSWILVWDERLHRGPALYFTCRISGLVVLFLGLHIE